MLPGKNFRESHALGTRARCGRRVHRVLLLRLKPARDNFREESQIHGEECLEVTPTVAPPTKERPEPLRQTAKHAVSRADRLAKQAEQYSPTEAVCIEIAVLVQGSRVVANARDVTDHTEPFQEEASTLIVFPQGAVVRLASRVAPGLELSVTNRRTNQTVSCRVVKVRSYTGGKGYVEIEFAERATGFWGISFPSEALARPSESAPPAAAPSAPIAGPTGLLAGSPPTPSASAIGTEDKGAPIVPSVPSAVKGSSAPDFRLVPPVWENKIASLATTEPNEQVSPAGPTSPAATALDSRGAGTSTGALPPRDEVEDVHPPSEVSSPPRKPLVPEPPIHAPERVRPLDFTALADEVAPAGTRPAPPGPPPSATAKGRGESLRSHRARASTRRAPRSSARRVFGMRLGQQRATNWPLEGQLRRILVLAGVSIGALILAWLGPAFFVHHGPASTLGAPVNLNPAATQAVLPRESAPQTAPAAHSLPTKGQSQTSVANAQPGSQPQPRGASAPGPDQQGSEPADISRLLAMPAGKIAGPVAKRGKARVQTEELPPPALGGEVPMEVPGGQGQNALGGILPGASPGNSAVPPPPVGGRVTPPELLSSAPPAYPLLAKKYKVQGDVAIQANIDAGGNVVRMKVVSGPPLLHQAAVDALRQWKYQPAKLDDQPVPMQILVTIKFRIR